MSKMSKKDKLIHDAQAAGFTINDNGMGKITIKKVLSITLFSNGYAIDNTANPSVAKSMRSFAEMRSCLDLPPEKEDKRS